MLNIQFTNNMKHNFVEWLQSLETQTLTDELKADIIDRFECEIHRAVDKASMYVDEVFWEEQYTYTKGEQYYDSRFND